MEDTITKTVTKQKIDFPKLWAVILHNDDFTPFEVVIAILVDLFNKTIEDAYGIAVHIHNNGKAVIATHPKDIADTKVSEIMSMAAVYEVPLQATSEKID